MSCMDTVEAPKRHNAGNIRSEAKLPFCYHTQSPFFGLWFCTDGYYFSIKQGKIKQLNCKFFGFQGIFAHFVAVFIFMKEKYTCENEGKVL